MAGARKDLEFTLDDLAECNRTGTGRCTFPEITPGISFVDFADERGFFRIAPSSSGSVCFEVPSRDLRVSPGRPAKGGTELQT
jgi:hypothetical protein